MALHDQFINKLANLGTMSYLEFQESYWKAAEVIKHLQEIIRSYNPDDTIFDDEKRNTIL